MKTSPFVLVLATAAAVATLNGCGSARAAAQEKDRLGNVRESVDLTVYKDDFAQVQEVRPVDLQKGRTRLAIGDVSKELDPNSFVFGWPDGKSDAQVVANVFELGIEAGGNLTNRFLGKKVEMVWYGEDGQEGAKEEGILEPAGNGQFALRTKDRLLVNPTGTVVAPTGSGVVTLPQLSVDVESSAAKGARLSVAYLTRGLSWSADYTATLDPGSDALNLECWATITNRTGADYPDAKLTLVAGSPNRAVMARASRRSLYLSYAKDDESLARPEQMGMGVGVAAPVAAGELYAYPVKDNATIAQEQMNRVRMLASPKTAIKKDYSVRLADGGAWYGYYDGRARRQNAQLAITFFNNEKSGLGMPLPGGAVRVYEPDANGVLRYVGAASVSDTPKEGKVELTLSNVFDVTSEFKASRLTKVDKKRTRCEYEAVLKNQKKRAVSLRVVQSLYGQWRLAEESHKSVKIGASMNQWTIEVPAGGEVKLRYAVVFGS